MDSSIPVQIDGRDLPFAWTGGLTAPQFNSMDVNNDGREDLIVFDRLSSMLLPFISSENGTFTYAPEFASSFPEGLDDWLLLRDFNGDGKKDIFVSTPLGMEVYVNTSSGGELSWRLFHSRAPGPSPLLTQGFNSAINLQLNASDKPEIVDVDQDGDLDILVFRFAGSSTVEYHRNYSLERDGNLDSLQLERETRAWGAFQECFCGTFAFDGKECGPPPGRPLHEGGKSLTILDITGDGVPEAFVSEETCDELFYLENGGTVEEAFMIDLLPYLENQRYPFFPAAYLEDIDRDGLNELLFASNWPSPSENRKEILPMLMNQGDGLIPDFVQQTDRFLLEDMIDLGGLSHPAFTDINSDGLIDVVVGYYADGESETPSAGVWYFMNTGSSGMPSFSLESPDLAPGIGQMELSNIRPEFIDGNGDGRSDLFFTAASETGFALYMIPNNGSDDPYTGQPEIVFNSLGSQDVVSFELINDDAIPDMLLGRNSGKVDLYTGVRSNGRLNFDFSAEGVFDLSNDVSRGPTIVRVADIDGDGRQDLFRADRAGGMAWTSDFESNSSETNWLPVFIRAHNESEALHKPGRNLVPVFVNLMQQDKEQLVLGSAGGGLQFFLADGSVTKPPPPGVVLYPNPVNGGSFVLQTGSGVRGYIIDAMGRVLTSEMEINPGQRVSTEALPDGFYILRIEEEGGARQSIPFIVRR